MSVQVRSSGVRWVGARGLAALVAASALSGGGCAARQAATSELEGLRARVVELEANRRRDGERIDSLTGRIVELEARGAPPAKVRPALPVVRVRPEQAAVADKRPASRRIAIEPAEELTEEEEPLEGLVVAEEEAEGSRPLLKLYESGEEETPVALGDAKVARRPRLDLASVGERLPVVPIPDIPGAPALEAALPEPTSPSAEEPQESVEEVMARARQTAQSGDCAVALRELGQVLARSPEHPQAPTAMLLRARCHRRQGSPLRAIGELELMARRYPRSGQLSEGLIDMAEAYVALGDLERARQIFGQVMRRFPQSQAASRATARVQALGRGVRAREE